jgi:hypothetical protein
VTDKLAVKVGDTGNKRATKSFSQKSIERAVRGARNAGFNLGRIEISPTGNIILWSADDVLLPENALQRELLDWRRKRGTH